MLSRPCGESRGPGLFGAGGPSPSVRPALSGLVGAGPAPPADSEHFPSWQGWCGFACMQMSRAHLPWRPAEEKALPVFCSQWVVPGLAAPGLCGAGACELRAPAGQGITVHGPPFHLRGCDVITTQPLVLS